MSLQESISTNLKEILFKMGKKQAWLANETGIKPQNISSYIRGVSLPDLSTICIIADKLGVSVDWLIGRCSSEQESKSGPKSIRQYAKEIVIIADTFNASTTKVDSKSCAPDQSVSIDFSEGSVANSDYNRAYYLFSDFMEAWVSYRELYIKRKIEKNDYELLTLSRIKKLPDTSIPDGKLLDDYIEANRLPWE